MYFQSLGLERNCQPKPLVCDIFDDESMSWLNKLQEILFHDLNLHIDDLLTKTLLKLLIHLIQRCLDANTLIASEHTSKFVLLYLICKTSVTVKIVLDFFRCNNLSDNLGYPIPV